MSSNVAPRIIADGLVLYLDAANQRSYAGGSSVWNDLTRNSYSGSLVNNPTYTPLNGGCIQFDGTNQYLEMISASSGSANSSYTFGGWFKTPAVSSFIYVRGRDGGFGAGWSARILSSASNKITAAVVTTSPGLSQTDTVGPIKTIQSNTWVNAYAVWIPGVSLSCYVNGDLDSTVDASTKTTLRTSTRGWSASIIRPDLIYASTIATYSVYNRALSAQEILQNYNSLKTRFGL